MSRESLNNLKERQQPFLNKKGQLEIPHFMSPDQACAMLQNRLDMTARQMRKMACANARIIVTDAYVDEKSKTVHPGDIQYDEKAPCQNDKREGSKWCQFCADAHASMPKEERERIAPPKRVNYSRKKRKQMKAKRS